MYNRPSRPYGMSELPPVIKNLLIINVLFFIASWVFAGSFNYDLAEILGLHHWSSDKFKVWQFVTHFFMHGSLMHIFFNMFALWMFGRVLENVWGGKRFLTYYVVTALGAALIYLLYSSYDISQLQDELYLLANSPTPGQFQAFLQDNVPLDNLSPRYKNDVLNTLRMWKSNPESSIYAERAISLAESFVSLKVNMPVVGASGAVFGVLLAFGMMFPNTELMLIFPPIPIKAKYFVIGYGAIELYMGIQNNPADNVAHFAHLGGMLFGYILIKFWQKNRNQFY